MEEGELTNGASVQKPMLLLVDDEAGIRKLGARLLEREGFKVITAENGVVGGNTFEGHIGDDPIIGVLSDVHMPRATGLEMYLQIQRCARIMGRQMPHFIFASGEAEGDDVTISTLRQVERQIVVAKPFDWILVANAFWGMHLRPPKP